MRVLLVKPKARLKTIQGLHRFTMLEPLELAYLAAVAGPRHTVHILDLRLERRPERAMAAALAAMQPDLVGISAYSHEGSTAKVLAGIVKRVTPRAFVVVGGHHATVAPEDLDVPAIDAIVRGEGCGPFAAILAAIEKREPVEGIPGVLRTGDGFDPAAARVWPTFPDPATLPLPRRDLYDWRRYFTVWLSENPPAWYPLFPPTAMVRSSFGCTQKCSFCIVPYLCAGRHMPRPVEAVADEIAGLPQDHVYFGDDENYLDEAFAFELADALERRGVRKRYLAWVRTTTAVRSPELMKRWAGIGLESVYIGFEHTTDAELKGSRKGATVAVNELALDLLKGMGVAVHGSWLVRPEFTEADFDHLAGYVAGLPPSEHSFNVITPSQGTPDYQAIQPRIWVSNPHDLHDAMHPLTPTTMPLRQFAARYARLVVDGIKRSPLRTGNRPVRPHDLVRALWSERVYYRAYRDLYRDYPRALWQ
ncbi:MAG: B12-binding domain-containing radical SAM protein [Thermoanaerobaculaceae bacterium]